MNHPWLRHYPPSIPHSLKPYPIEPAYQTLQQAAQDSPHHNFLYFYGKKFTYSQIDQLSSSFARLLQTKYQIKKGDHVGLFLPNMPEFVITFFAILKAGAVVVPLNTLADKKGIKHQITTAKLKHLIVLDRFLDRLPHQNFNTFICLKVNSFLPWHLKLLTSFSKSPGKDFNTLLQSSPIFCPQKLKPKTDLALLLFTSGVRGKPKAVMIAHFNLTTNSRQAQVWSQTYHDKTPSLMPLFHCYGIIASLMCTLYSRSTYYLYPKLNLNRILKDSRIHGFTFYTAVPLIYRLIASHKLFKPDSFPQVWTMASGGEQPDKKLLNQYQNLPLCQGYGLTEATSVVIGNPVCGQIKKTSMGIPLPDTNAKIVDNQGKTLPPGKTGQLLIKGPQLMKGYYQNPKLTRQTVKNDWLHTGDLCYMDTDGYFYFVRRQGSKPKKPKLKIT